MDWKFDKTTNRIIITITILEVTKKFLTLFQLFFFPSLSFLKLLSLSLSYLQYRQEDMDAKSANDSSLAAICIRGNRVKRGERARKSGETRRERERDLPLLTISRKLDEKDDWMVFENFFLEI